MSSSVVSSVELPVGLIYVPNFISEEEHDNLLNRIDQENWDCSMNRKVLHYGYKYDYKSRTTAQQLGDLPAFTNFLITRAQERNLISTLPDQLIINNYEPGQGIAFHVDKTDIFEDNIWAVSLGSDIMMQFKQIKTQKIINLLLEKNSLFLMSDESRYLWMHSIAALKYDSINGVKVERKRRVSLTFRKMK